MGMSIQIHDFELPGLVLYVGPVLNPLESRLAEPLIIHCSASDEQLGLLASHCCLSVLSQEERQVPM